MEAVDVTKAMVLELIIVTGIAHTLLVQESLINS